MADELTPGATVEQEVAAPAAEPVNTSLRDALSSALEKSKDAAPAPAVAEKPAPAAEAPKDDRPRHPDGKFAPKQAEPAAAPAPVEPKPVVQGPKAPSTWRKEVSAKWDALDPDIKAEVIRREMNIHEGLAQYRGLAEHGRAIEQAAAPYKEHLTRLGATPVQLVSELLPAAMALTLGSPEQKVQALLNACRNAGIDPATLASHAQPQADPHVAALQGQIGSMQQMLAQQRAEAERQRMYAAQAEEQQLLQQVEQFKARAPHFDAVRQQMAQLLNSGAASTLEEAYSMAVYADDALRSQAFTAPAVPAAAQAAAAAKAKAVSVKGAPTGQQAPTNPQDRRNVIAYAMGRHRV